MAELNDREKAKILRYLGYADWSSVASSFQLGYPSPSDPEFLVRDAFARITDEGLELVRRDLCELESIEDQLHSCRKRMKASKLGDLQVNADEPFMLRREMTYWTSRLSDDLGAPINPFSSATTGVGGRNAKVC